MNGTDVDWKARCEMAQDATELFTQAITHDLREPLSTVLQFSQLIESDARDELSDRCRDWLQRVFNNAKRANNMLARLREFATLKIDEEKLAEVDLNEVIQRAIEKANEEVPQRRVELDCGELSSIHGDPELIHRMFVELLRNSLENGTDDKVRIRIAGRKDRDRIALSLEDSGRGIRRDDCETALLPLRRVHATTQDEVPRTGMGLTIAEKIVALHGGGLKIQPGSRGGVRIQIDLPSH